MWGWMQHWLLRPSVPPTARQPLLTHTTVLLPPLQELLHLPDAVRAAGSSGWHELTEAGQKLRCAGRAAEQGVIPQPRAGCCFLCYSRSSGTGLLHPAFPQAWIEYHSVPSEYRSPDR